MANGNKDDADKIVGEFSKKYDACVELAKKHADMAFAYWQTLCAHGIHPEKAFVLTNSYILNLQDNEFELEWRTQNGQCNN